MNQNTNLGFDSATENSSTRFKIFLGIRVLSSSSAGPNFLSGTPNTTQSMVHYFEQHTREKRRVFTLRLLPRVGIYPPNTTQNGGIKTKNLTLSRVGLINFSQSTYLPSYLPTYLPTYLLSKFPTYLLTYLPIDLTPNIPTS